MRQRGTIKGWKDDKGFGFVTPLAGGEEAFVHINAFLNRQRRPVNGDEISYDAMQDFQKRWQAKAIRYADEPAPSTATTKAEAAFELPRSSNFSALPMLRILLVLLVLAILGLAGQQIWARTARAGLAPVIKPAELLTQTPNSPYQCDGRTRCQQMHSCEEANWFIANCPNTQMDGDGDGVACEQQWCDD